MRCSISITLGGLPVPPRPVGHRPRFHTVGLAHTPLVLLSRWGMRLGLHGPWRVRTARTAHQRAAPSACGRLASCAALALRAPGAQGLCKPSRRRPLLRRHAASRARADALPRVRASRACLACVAGDALTPRTARDALTPRDAARRTPSRRGPPLRPRSPSWAPRLRPSCSPCSPPWPRAESRVRR